MQEYISIHLKELDEKIENSKIEGCCVWTLENYITRYVKTLNKKQLEQEEDCGAIIHKMIGG